jgi:hypothetical protein
MKGTVIGLTLASLVVATGGAAWAQTVEHTYLPPFEAVEQFLSGCDAPWCEGSATADTTGSMTAEIQVLGAGIGRSDIAQGAVKLTHVLVEPATHVSVEVRLHVTNAFASAVGAPFARASANVAVEAWPAQSSWAYKYAQVPVAIAESPIGEDQAGEQDVTLSVTLGDGKRLIKGPIDIVVPVFAETTTMPPHAPVAGAAAGCNCFGAGKVEARIAATVQSVTVREER